MVKPRPLAARRGETKKLSFSRRASWPCETAAEAASRRSQLSTATSPIPAKPVPYRPRPVTPTYPGQEWQVWMVEDQRFTHQRPDVLSYETEPLDEDVTVAGSLVRPSVRLDDAAPTATSSSAHRRLSGEICKDPSMARLSAAHQRRTGAGPFPQELRETRAGGGRTR